jgi:hypothetical protein
MSGVLLLKKIKINKSFYCPLYNTSSYRKIKPLTPPGISFQQEKELE